MKKRLQHRILLLLVAGVFSLLSVPAMAQTEFITPAQQKKELRKSLREAKKIKSDYQETHLNVEAFNFKRGESGRKRIKDLQDHDDMLMNKDGIAVAKKQNKPKKMKATKKRTRK